jgi:hypothetical protein
VCTGPNNDVDVESIKSEKKKHFFRSKSHHADVSDVSESSSLKSEQNRMKFFSSSKHHRGLENDVSNSESFGKKDSKQSSLLRRGKKLFSSSDKKSKKTDKSTVDKSTVGKSTVDKPTVDKLTIDSSTEDISNKSEKKKSQKTNTLSNMLTGKSKSKSVSMPEINLVIFFFPEMGSS